MADPVIYFNRRTKMFERVNPPELLKLVQYLKDTDLAVIPEYLIDMTTGKKVPVQLRYTDGTHNKPHTID